MHKYYKSQKAFGEVCLQTLLAVWRAYGCTMNLIISNMMAAALLYVALKTKMFEFISADKNILRPNFTTRTTNIQTLGLNLTNLTKLMT